MNRETDILTLEELESLAHAYLEARLSLIQEKELLLVLESTALDSPLLNKTRETMEIVSEFEASHVRKSKHHLRRLSAAAVAILILSVAGIRYFTPTPKNETCIVYVDGKKLTEREAQKFASQVQIKKMASFEETLQKCNELQNSSQMILKSVTQ